MNDQTVISSRRWVRPLHVLLGSLVLAVGAWLAWNALSLHWVALLAMGAGGFLWWQASTIRLIWAWTTLLLGLESLVWPLMTMYQIHQLTGEPNDDQMSMILSAVSFGFVSAVFWMSFSYGLFARTGKEHSEQPAAALPPQPVAGPERQQKTR